MMANWGDSDAEARADVVRAEGAARALAGLAAAVGWAALALQLVLIAGTLGAGTGLWRYLGYFTVLTNIGTAAVASAGAMGSGGRIGGARARLMAATSIAMVGLTYTIALRALWHPTGLQKLADIALHDAVPLLFLLTWAMAPHGSLDRRDFAWALVPPALYAAYAMGRGAIDGWYAYWFLDPGQQSGGELATSIAVMIAAVGVIAVLLIVIDRWKGRGATA